jgi:hypothetical protein
MFILLLIGHWIVFQNLLSRLLVRIIAIFMDTDYRVQEIISYRQGYQGKFHIAFKKI